MTKAVKRNNVSEVTPEKTVAASEPLLGDENFEGLVEAAPLPTDDDLSKVRKLAETQVALERRIAKGQALLKQLNDQHKDIAERQLPLAMKSLHMKFFGLDDGSKITLKDVVAAGIPKAMTETAHAWLEVLHAALIKHKIEVIFGRDEDAWAKKFMRDMAQRKKQLNYKRKDWVEPQTLGAFVRGEVARLRGLGRDPYGPLPDAETIACAAELTSKGKALPPDLAAAFDVLPKDALGVYEVTVAEVELPEGS